MMSALLHLRQPEQDGRSKHQMARPCVDPKRSPYRSCFRITARTSCKPLGPRRMCFLNDEQRKKLLIRPGNPLNRPRLDCAGKWAKFLKITRLRGPSERSPLTLVLDLPTWQVQPPGRPPFNTSSVLYVHTVFTVLLSTTEYALIFTLD